MAVSRGLRRAMKNRTRRSRRLEVVFFFFVMTWGLSYAGRPFRWAELGRARDSSCLCVRQNLPFVEVAADASSQLA